MSFEDDDAAEVRNFRPPPHPDDRLWRHPSEITGERPERPRHARRSRRRRLPWAIAAGGTASVILAGAAALVVGLQEEPTAETSAPPSSTEPEVSPTTATTSTFVTPSTEQFVDVLGTLRRLGIEAQESAEHSGVAVAAVDPAGPAAGELQADDIIVDVEGQMISDLSTLAGILQARDPGEEILVTILRPDDNTTLTIPLTVGELTDGTSSASNAS